MPPAAVVVVGASAGGVEALRVLVAGLPAGLDAAVLVVLHIPRRAPSALPAILNRSGPLPAAHAVDGELLDAGRIYVAPPDHHLLVSAGRVRLSAGPSENGHRPAVDPLFRSAAQWAGPRTVAVVLSGSRDDGTAGAAAVVRRGGRLLVQDPDEALHASMPRSAMELVGAERVVGAAKLGAALAELVEEVTQAPPPAVPEAEGEPFEGAVPPGENLLILETAMANMEDLTTDELSVQPSGLACPSCHGGLFELPGEPAPRFRCRVGHAWSPQSLLDEQAEAFEGALWVALRSLEEKAELSRRLADLAILRGSLDRAEQCRTSSAAAEEAGRLIRQLIVQLGKVDENASGAASFGEAAR
ncbi:MAG TPA: chemotaxis protein CheB [Micromonosporaceae bacterium]|nr:chemotaxis protein CheB [Micromonosporaceae bacterium]